MVSKLVEAILFTQAKEAHIQSLKARHMSPETIRGYQVDLNQFQDHLSNIKNGPVYVDEITEADVKKFHQSFVQKGLKPASLRRKLNSVSSFFTFAIRKKWATFNPTEDIERVPVINQERSFLDAEEIQKLLQSIDHPIIYYFVVMMVNTGLRVSECANLTVRDVDLDKGIVQVIEGKGGKNRQVPMNSQLIEIMQHYRKEIRPSTSSFNFFATEKTGGVSPQYVNVILKEAAQKAGIDKRVTSHALRHSFATQLVRSDTHIAVIQHLLGHADVRTTSVYMHANTKDMEDAVDSLSFLSDVKEGGKYDKFT